MHPSRYAFLTTLALAASCASSDTTSPTVDVNALVDQTGVATYSAAALSASVPGVTATVPVPSSSTSSCAYSATDQRFNCAPVTVNGLTITRSYALLDASGHSLSISNLAAIASIRSITDIKGTLTGTGTTGTSMTIDRHEDATLTDLLAATHVLNGTATQKLDFVVTGLTFSSNETSTTANLRLPSATAATHWPLGGTITTDRTMTISGLPGATTSHEVLAFDGTSVMTLTRTSGSVTTTCKFDLSKPAVLPVCS
jgi:hypothetical protein